MCLNIYNYFKLCYRLYSYYSFYQNNNEHNITILDNIIFSVQECGSVMIKFCQWITPKLELIYLDTVQKDEEKPQWLIKLENFYEKCENHSLEYTKNHYYHIFNENIEDKYSIGDIIGSGSIGQTYLLTEKSTGNEYVMKILHPNVKKQISFFKRFMKIILYFSCIKNKFKKIFPFDLFEFIDQFNQQTNFIDESNHLLYFYKEYENNNFIIIPRLIKCSQSIIIMTYEKGVSLDDSKLDDYQKNKIVNLYHLFVRNNQMLKNYNHGDLHPGNWKVSIDEENNKDHKLVFYDFGYCWSIPNDLFKEVGTTFFDTFEECDNINPMESIDKLTHLMYLSILYPDGNKDEFKKDLKRFVEVKFKNLDNLNIYVCLKIIVEYCINHNLYINPILLQCFIILIQGQKMFEKYGLMTSKNNVISDYTVYREKYLDILTFCRTYNIFPEHSEYIEYKLNNKQIEVTNIFDTIDLDESIKELLIPK
uniref:Protein kinase domain-containing protein n=1 Tax=viral metagenome TaxID=1070528 RepID=A0A6C0BT22_9ZZZZ